MTNQYFTVFGGSFIHEAREHDPVRTRPTGTLAVWGLVLASLLIGATTVATVAATTWAHAAAVIH